MAIFNVQNKIKSIILVKYKYYININFFFLPRWLSRSISYIIFILVHRILLPSIKLFEKHLIAYQKRIFHKESTM